MTPELRSAIDRGVLYLAETQRADGTWDEELFTGTGFPGDFYINYHLYRLVFPLTALGRAVDFYRANQQHSAHFHRLDSR
jgi:squalene-hopene/tetraprenyl-beta-curcumene cyclase